MKIKQSKTAVNKIPWSSLSRYQIEKLEAGKTFQGLFLYQKKTLVINVQHTVVHIPLDNTQVFS